MNFIKWTVGGICLATAGIANAYNVQVDVGYFDEDDGFDTSTIAGAYYFDDVSIEGTAWDEAAFMGRNTNVSLSYFDLDGFADATSIAFEYYGGDNNFYAALGYTYLDTEFGGSNDATSVELGYFFGENWLVSAGAAFVDQGDDPWFIETKYIAELGNGSFVNLEANYTDDGDDGDLTGIVDYYFLPHASVGLLLTDSDAVDYAVRGQYYFLPTIGLRAVYEDYADGDVYGIGLTARF